MNMGHSVVRFFSQFAILICRSTGISMYFSPLEFEITGADYYNLVRYLFVLSFEFLLSQTTDI